MFDQLLNAWDDSVEQMAKPLLAAGEVLGAELLIVLTAAGLLFALAAVIGFVTLAVKRRRARNRA